MTEPEPLKREPDAGCKPEEKVLCDPGLVPVIAVLPRPS